MPTVETITPQTEAVSPISPTSNASKQEHLKGMSTTDQENTGPEISSVFVASTEVLPTEKNVDIYFNARDAE